MCSASRGPKAGSRRAVDHRLAALALALALQGLAALALPLALQGLTTTVTAPAIHALGTLTTAISLLVIALALSAAAWLGRRGRRQRA